MRLSDDQPKPSPTAAHSKPAETGRLVRLTPRAAEARRDLPAALAGVAVVLLDAVRGGSVREEGHGVVRRRGVGYRWMRERIGMQMGLGGRNVRHRAVRSVVVIAVMWVVWMLLVMCGFGFGRW